MRRTLNVDREDMGHTLNDGHIVDCQGTLLTSLVPYFLM